MTDISFVQSVSKYFVGKEGLFTNISDGPLPSRIREINPTDMRKVPSGHKAPPLV